MMPPRMKATASQDPNGLLFKGGLGRHEGAFKGQVEIDASGNDQDADTRSFALKEGDGAVTVQTGDNGHKISVAGGTIYTDDGNTIAFVAKEFAFSTGRKDGEDREYVFVALDGGVYTVQAAQDLPTSGDYYVLGEVELPTYPYVDVKFEGGVGADGNSFLRFYFKDYNPDGWPCGISHKIVST